MRPMCSLCGSKHFQREPHVFASNKAENASNAASNGGKSASNELGKANPAASETLGRKESGGGRRSSPVRLGVDGESKAGQGIEPGVRETAVGGTKQRWAKAKYNAYMRNLMAIKRQTPKAIAENRAVALPK